MELTSEQIITLWFHYEEIAMHFNELIIQYRLQLMGGVGAIGVLASYLTIQYNEVSPIGKIWAITSALTLILVFGAAILDIFYYSRLLDGAVEELIQFEKSHSSINMSTRIAATVDGGARYAVCIWYATVIIPLVLFTVWSWFYGPDKIGGS
jgi:hypothetical protein